MSEVATDVAVLVRQQIAALREMAWVPSVVIMHSRTWILIGSPMALCGLTVAVSDSALGDTDFRVLGRPH